MKPFDPFSAPVRLITVSGLFLLAALSPLPGQTLQVGKPVRHRGLTLFPVLSRSPLPSGNYLTLREGLASGKVILSELTSTPAPAGENSAPVIGEVPTPSPMEDLRLRPPPKNRINSNEPQVQVQQQQIQSGRSGPRVDTLAIRNLSKRSLFLMAGEIIQGGKQNRVVKFDTLIPPGEEPVDLGVFCVEQSRWSGKGEKDPHRFKSSPDALAQTNLRSVVVRKGSQSQVWSKVEELNRMQGKESRTHDYTLNLSDKKRKVEAEKYASALEKGMPEGSVGVLLFRNGNWLGGDLIYDPALFRSLRRKILQGYIHDAIGSDSANEAEREGGGEAMAGKARQFLRAMDEVRGGKLLSKSEEGAYYKIEGSAFEGGYFRLNRPGEERILHLAAFPKEE